MSDFVQTPTLCLLYRQYLDDQDATIFAGRASRRYTQGTLQRLAENPNAEVRRAAVLALGFLGNYDANHTVGRALNDDDRTVRILAENAIRNLWGRFGDQDTRQRLFAVTRLLSAQQYRKADALATDLIKNNPDFAEAWRQRAIAKFHLELLVDSIRDNHQTLELNPYHFDAAVGMAQAYLQLDNQISALECFRRALRLNPNLEGVRVQIDRLSRLIEGR